MAALAAVAAVGLGVGACFTDGTLPCETSSDCFETQYCKGGECVPIPEDAGDIRVEDTRPELPSMDTDVDTQPEADTADGGDADADVDTCTPEAEMCNGRDDDCDGEIDEPKTCSSEGVCQGVTVTCSNGTYESCEDQYGPEYESDEQSIDGKDNDCDGQTDELFKKVELHTESLVCGITVDDAVYCWGRNASDIPKAFPIDNATYVDLATGHRFMCGLKNNGGINCWGETLTGRSITPPKGTDYTAISGAGSSVCAVKMGGEVDCWSGEETWSGVGPGRANNGTIATGDDARCGLYDGVSSRAECWKAESGGNVDANLIDNEPSTNPFSDIDVASGEFACAIQKGSGGVFCWGAQGARKPRNPPSSGFADVGVSNLMGNFYACGIVNDTGAVKCWGFTRTDVYNPPDEGTFEQLHLGASGQSCAVAQDDTIECWGGVDGPS